MPILPYASFSNSVPPLYQPGSHQSTFTSPLAQTELPAYSRNRLLAQEEIEPDFPSNPRPVSERRPSTSPLHRPNQIHAPKSKGQHSRTRPEPSNGMKIQKEGTTLGKMDSQKKVITREDRGSQHGGEQVYPGHPVQRSSRPSRSVARNLGRTDVRIGNKEVEIMPRARMYHHPGRNHGTRHTPRGHRSDPEARSSSDHDDQSNRSDDDLSSDELDDPISLKDSGHDESDDEDELGDNDDRTEDEISLDDDEDGHGDENGDPEVDVDGGNRRPLIPKPEGEAGRPGRGGYTLSQSLGWKTKEYRRFTVRVCSCPDSLKS